MDNILYSSLEIHLQRKSERALKIPGKKKSTYLRIAIRKIPQKVN